MFILYAVPIGLLVGLLLGGRLSGLGDVRFQWAWLAVLGFAAQVVLFSDPVTARIGDLGPPLYVVSTALVFIAVLRNVAIRGMPLIAAGAGCNLAAIVANGGTITHHHAIGRDHAPWLRAEVGDVGLDLIRAAKQRLDPVGIMNPGKLLP